MSTTAEIIVEVHHPYQWTSGPRVHTLNEDLRPFADLKEAEAYARSKFIPGHHEESTRVSFGTKTMTEVTE